MTTYQKAANVLVAIRRETTAGSIATVTGAVQARILDSPGLELKRAPIQSQEKRADGLMSMGRLGYKTVDGSFNAELTSGGAIDSLIEAIMRSSWVASYTVGFATLTTVAVGSNTLTANGGSWITQGLRVGDIFYLNGTSVAGDNSINKTVVALTTLTLTTEPAAFTTIAATATGTVVVLKKVKNGATPTSYTYSVEQNDTTIDLSEVFLGCMPVGMKLSFKPGAPATATFSFLGTDRTALATGTSPYFTSPTLTTGLALIADDSVIRYNGAAVANFTGFDLDFQITAKGEPVIGSLVTPAIFDNDMAVSGSISALRSDFSNLTLFDAETEFEVSIKLEEPGSTPKNCLAIYLPRVKLSAVNGGNFGGDGAKVETLTLMVGPKTAATGYDGTVATISSSAA